MNTITRQQQLEVNGLTSTFAKDLFPLDNVYYIGDTQDRYLSMFADYMQTHCGASGYEVTDTIIDGIVAVHQAGPTRTVLDWLREQVRATGTKEGCNEGDCGACTVVIGELTGADQMQRLLLRPVNACIHPAGRPMNTSMI